MEQQQGHLVVREVKAFSHFGRSSTALPVMVHAGAAYHHFTL